MPGCVLPGWHISGCPHLDHSMATCYSMKPRKSAGRANSLQVGNDEYRSLIETRLKAPVGQIRSASETCRPGAKDGVRGFFEGLMLNCRSRFRGMHGRLFCCRACPPSATPLPDEPLSVNAILVLFALPSFATGLRRHAGNAEIRRSGSVIRRLSDAGVQTPSGAAARPGFAHATGTSSGKENQTAKPSSD
jgi:hypothetical protein